MPAAHRAVFVAILVGGCGGRARDEVAELRVVTDLGPAFLVAEPAVVTIAALDSAGIPVEGAAIDAVLLLGEDEEKGVEAIEASGGEYVATFTVEVAGVAMLHAWERESGASVDAAIELAAGTPEAVTIAARAIGDEPGAWELVARVEDNWRNPVPQAGALAWSTTAGTIDDLGTTLRGVATARLQLDAPGLATITATAFDGALTHAIELQRPQLALTCPPAVHLTGDATEDRAIPVTLSGDAGGLPIAGYDLVVRANELTGFAETGTSSGLAPLLVEPLGDGAYRLATDPTMARLPGDGELTELDFECLGEGMSEIDFVEGTLFAIDAEGLTEIPIAFWEDASCPNKRIKDLCIQPILVTGEQGAGATAADVTARLTAEVARLQDDLDEACCRILVELRPLRELAAPASYAAEVAENTDGDRERVVQVEWDARSVDSDLPREIRLSTGMKDLMCAPDVRDDACINVYLVKDGSSYGKFPAVPDGPNMDRENARRVEFEEQAFGGADIKRSRLNPDGTGCEMLAINERTAAGVQPIAADSCKIDGIILPLGQVSPADGAPQRTFRHEIGHLLGLRHPWEYSAAQGQKIKDDEVDGKTSLMHYRAEANAFTATECGMIDAHNCNGYQRPRGQ